MDWRGGGGGGGWGPCWINGFGREDGWGSRRWSGVMAIVGFMRKIGGRGFDGLWRVEDGSIYFFAVEMIENLLHRGYWIE